MSTTRKRIHKIKILSVLLLLLFVGNAKPDPITENEVEDLNLLISQFIGGQSDLLLIFDMSRSSVQNYGGVEVGEWDGRNITDSCQIQQRVQDSSGNPQPYAVAHCMENAAGIHQWIDINHDGAETSNEEFGCGSLYCTSSPFGTCEDDTDFSNFLSCIERRFSSDTKNAAFGVALSLCGASDATLLAKLPSSVVTGGTGTGVTKADVITQCGTLSANNAKKIKAAAAIDNSVSYLTQTSGNRTCGAKYCTETTTDSLGITTLNILSGSVGGNDQSCDSAEVSTTGANNDLKDCMTNTRSIPTDNSTCSGRLCSKGTLGSSRNDAIRAAIFDLLDADDTVYNINCQDTGGLYSGTSNANITCAQYLSTPFRDLQGIPSGTGNGSTLPLGTGNPGGTGNKLTDYLTSNDGDILNIRFNSMAIGGKDYGGSGAGRLTTSGNGADTCFSNSTLDADQGGFAGSSQQKLQNTWGYYKQKIGGGRTSIAGALGFDDNDSSSGGLTSNDVLNQYQIEIKTDAACSCRQSFVVLITQGEDSCLGDCNATPTSCAYSLQPAATRTVQNPITTNANRRSVLQAVSTLRTHFARDPVVCNALGGDVKKEIMTFVVGFGVKNNKKAVRTMNAMALLGGTSTKGILKHEGPSGGQVGSVSLGGSDPFLTDASTVPSVYFNIAKMSGFGSNPSSVLMEDCGVSGNLAEVSENGSCTFKGDTVFDNSFFDSSTPPAAAFDSTVTGTSFAFFADNPAKLVQALKEVFKLTGEFQAAGAAPSAPGSTGSLAVRDRIFLANLKPRLDEPIWQGRLALFGFIDDPTNPGAKLVVRAPRDSSHEEFINTSDETPDTSAILSAVIFTATGALNSNAQEYHWEAGKQLAERDLADVNEPRKLITVDPTQIMTDFEVMNSVKSLNYKSELIAFDENTITTGFFGISDADVTADTLALCDTSSCLTGPSDVCGPGIGDQGCKDCVKTCIKNYVVDFMSGDTGIVPSDDAYGVPDTTACPGSGDTPKDKIGCGCPDPVTGTGGSLDRCSIRLGDIFHATPILVGSPSALFFDTGFQTFAREFINRSAVVYAGANDGFLHAFHAGELVDTTSLPSRNPFTSKLESLPFFDDQGGNELFAFTSPTMLTDSRAPVDIALSIDKDPTSPPSDFFGYPTPEYRYGDMKTLLIDDRFQRSFFDSTPLIADVWLDSNVDDFNGLDCSRTGCQAALNALPMSLKSPSSADGVIDAFGREWHTVLITGYRNGGGAYTALDVTNVDATDPTDKTVIPSLPDYKKFDNGPDYPRHLWTVHDEDFGNTWSEPVLGRIRVDWKDGGNNLLTTTDRWVVFVGGGLDPNINNVDPLEDVDGDGLIDIVDPDNTIINAASDADPVNPDDPYFGNAFYAIDIASGKIIYKFSPSDSTLTNSDKMVCDLAGQPGSFDLNADGYVDVVYIGDVCGRLWRFDVSKNVEAQTAGSVGDLQDAGIKGNPIFDTVPWAGSIAFCANTDANCRDASGPIIPPPGSPTNRANAIYSAPTVVLDNLGRKHVIFTTGDRRDPTNADLYGKLYNFIDSYVPAFIGGGIASNDVLKTESDLSVTVNITQSGTNLSGLPNFTVDPDPMSTDGEYVVDFPNGCNTSEDSGCAEGGEKGIGTPIVFQNVVLFTTFAPDVGSANLCTAGLGVGRLFGIDLISGLPALSRIQGASALLGSNFSSVAGTTVGEGVPSPARLTIGSKGSIIMSVAFSGSGVSGGSTYLVIELGSLPAQTQTLFWEEII